MLVNEDFEQLENNGPEAWQQQLQAMDDHSAYLLSDFVGRSDPTWAPAKGRKNRYANVQPYTATRVKLTPFSDEYPTLFTDDYINASEMKIPKANRWYIVTQAPLNATVPDFWRMIYQQNVKNIVMLCHKEGTSCAVDYWPTPKQPLVDNGATRATFMNQVEMPDMTVTSIQLRHRDETPYNVTHYHYKGWKDMQIPTTESFLNFLGQVQPALNDDQSPTAVHCTGGVGRSGTFVLVDSALALIQRGQNVDILKLLRDLRQLRYGLVETPEQLRFAYEAVKSAQHSLNNEKPSIL